MMAGGRTRGRLAATGSASGMYEHKNTPTPGRAESAHAVVGLQRRGLRRPRLRPSVRRRERPLYDLDRGLVLDDDLDIASPSSA